MPYTLPRGTPAPSQRPATCLGPRAPVLPAPPAAWAHTLSTHTPPRAIPTAATNDAASSSAPSSSSSGSNAAAAAARAAKSPATSPSDEWCAVAYVHVDNHKNPMFTVMEIEIADYPGLLRVVAWCLNGLEMVAQNAILSTSADGIAHNTFWLSTRAGGKLSDAAAELLAERVREYLAYCSPRPEEEEQTEFALGPIAVSNTVHSQYTVVTVAEQRRTPGFLLEVASVLSGLNVQVLQGVIQGCTDCGEDVPAGLNMAGAEEGARIFEFWVRNQEGNKLPAAHVRALLYALGLGLGLEGTRFPLSPPNRDLSAALERSLAVTSD